MLKYLLILLVVYQTITRNLQIISIDGQNSNSTVVKIKNLKQTAPPISQNKTKQKAILQQQPKNITNTSIISKQQPLHKSITNSTSLNSTVIISNETVNKSDSNITHNASKLLSIDIDVANITNKTTFTVFQFRPTFTIVPTKSITIQQFQSQKTRKGDQGLNVKLLSPQLVDTPGFKKVFAKQQSEIVSPQLIKLKDIKRIINGSNNNLENKNWGVTNTSQARLCPSEFENQKFQPVTNRPNPRQVSNVVGRVRKEPHLNKNNVTLAFTIWGQFVDHDIQITPGSQKQFLHIPIPKCDDFFDSDCNGTRVIPFTRSVISNDSDKRVPINGITTWMDASMIYGSSDQQAKKLRKFINGQMKMDKFKFKLLPEGQPIFNEFDNKTLQTMEGGDVRSNQNLVLLSFQTLFLREHNRICDIITRKQLKLTDDEIYTIAKNYVNGLIQKITYDDFLPILFGPEAYKKIIGDYPGYDKKSDPTIQLQFSSTAYRFGHSLVIGKFPLVNFEGDKVEVIKMDDALFRPELMTSSNLDRIIRGSTRSIAKERDGQFVDQLRDLLIIAPQLRHVRMDLLSINIQRGRELGMPNYNSFRQCLGLKKIEDFNQISAEQTKNNQLKQIYKQLDKIDSYVGIQAEKSVQGSVLGQTSIVVIGQTFKKIRNGDRFWYQNAYPPEIVKQIKNTKLSQVILRNTAIKELQQDVFHYNFPQPQ